METNPRPTKVLIVKLMDKVMHGRVNGVGRSKDTHRSALFNSIFMTSKIEGPLGLRIPKRLLHISKCIGGIMTSKIQNP